MPKLTAAQFRALIDRTARVRDSLASCRNSEVLRETETVLRVASELQSAQLLRASVQLETERRAMLDSVARTARFRMDNRSARLVETRRIPHAAHYMYDHPGRGHDLEEWIVESVVRPDYEQLAELGLPADAEWHTGHRADGVQRWTYIAKRSMSAGTCERC